MRAAIILFASLAACSDVTEPAKLPPTNMTDNGVPVPPQAARSRPKPDAEGPGTALGLTYLQLEDADLIGPTGATLGEVERIDADAAGTISGLIVELADERMIRVPIGDLAIVPDGDDWNLRTNKTAADLASLPSVAR